MLLAALRKDAVSDDDCRRAVRAAAAEGHLDAVERGTCRSALLIAAARKKGEAVRALLSRGASVEARGDAGESALELASAAGHRLVVDELLTHTRGVAVDASAATAAPPSSLVRSCWPPSRRAARSARNA